MSSTKDGAGYLDGVPIKISAKFIPPNPVTMPLAYETTLSADFFKLEYDFSFERSVLDSIERRQNELDAIKIKSVQKTADLPSEETSSFNPVVKPSNSQNALSLNPDTILQPKQSADKIYPDNKPQKSSFNLSDFENDTSSPFDYMELQTINDLEELSSVFQGLHNVSVKKPVEDPVEVENVPSSKEDATVAKSVSFPLPQNVLSDKVSSSLSEDFSSNVKRASFSDYLSYALPSISAEVHPGTYAVPKGFPCDNFSYSTLSQVPYISSNAGAYSVQKGSSLRASKSYTDVHTIPDSEIIMSQKERSHTPPTFMPERTQLVHPAVEDFSQRLRSPKVVACNGLVNGDTSTYEELDEAGRTFVDSITEMGFPKGQVARAVKHLGIDEKKVVEHLCHIQALEESGYESSDAEAALHLHDYNCDQAKEFLDLVNQFQDLGFEKEAVKKALVQNKNDWNKTIDALLPGN